MPTPTKVKVWIPQWVKASLTPELEAKHKAIIARYNDRLMAKGYHHAQITTLADTWSKHYTHMVQPVDTMHVIVFHKRRPRF
jgi:hypothetical protein